MAGARRRVDDRRHRPAEVEVGDGLHGRSRIHAQELRRPRARGDDGHPRAHAARGDAVAVLVDRFDADVLAHLEAVGERRDGFVRMDDPAVRLEQAALARVGADAESMLDLACIEHLERRPARRECIAVRLPVTEVERALQLEQAPAALRLELAPEREGLLREPDPALVRVGQAHDPRAAVARPARVAELELLADDDVAPRLGECPCGGEPHHPGSDDDDLGVEGAHGPQRNERLAEQVEELTRGQPVS